MSRFEETLLTRWSGQRIALASVAFAAVCVLPLLLYVAFGPANGNPIGLGLLAMLAVPIAGVGVLVGIVKMLVQHFGRRRGD